ncbi:hypothetical protein RHMOL_Rhmol12G0062600 [Rhododendron molle]|uniref:Uncharacterized protein n=1 Tax=Rhododendron molle TaxID=49168 RepID=A0ACC0LFV1_RHOML|nr:hypothetical protein RHMOL_Rhmol12G0062600 [Rhododendron molle]
MEVENSKKNKQSSYFSWLACCTKSPPISSSTSFPPSPEVEFPEKDSMVLLPSSKITKRKPAGWKAMPYVLGNETFERLATFGLMGNFMIFLLTKFNMEQASAANVLNIWSGVTNFAPLIGAFISDAYIGRFWTIGVASFASLVGMGTLTLIAWKPELHPPPCTQQQLHGCQGPTTPQLCFLFLALGFLSIATGGIRPCSLPFGVDQFDATTDEGRKGINSFFNWYYTTFTVVLILALTVVVYIQDNVSWVLGFGIPAGFMLGSILLFYFGTRLYVYVKPEGSVFSGIAQAVVSAYKKRKVKFPAAVEGEVPAAFGVLYDPPLKGTIVTKLPLTNQYRCLNKAAIALDGEVNPDGSRVNPWTLCSIQQIEEVKCLIKVMPVWVSGGITLLQRIGTGIVFSALSMAVAGVVEKKRRDSALSHGGGPISVMWLAPQLILLGFCEAFNIIGQIEFYYKEFPENMSSVANALFFCTFSLASYLSSFIVTIVHRVTGGGGRPNWLANDINAGRVDYFYYVIAGMGVVNFVYFLIVARKYNYKVRAHFGEEKSQYDVELDAVKQ